MITQGMPCQNPILSAIGGGASEIQRMILARSLEL
jgi:hypothetical protein